MKTDLFQADKFHMVEENLEIAGQPGYTLRTLYVMAFADVDIYSLSSKRQ